MQTFYLSTHQAIFLPYPTFITANFLKELKKERRILSPYESN